jgi:hypothetical protein
MEDKCTYITLEVSACLSDEISLHQNRSEVVTFSQVALGHPTLQHRFAARKETNVLFQDVVHVKESLSTLL